MWISDGHAGVPTNEMGPTFSGRVWSDPVLAEHDGVRILNVFFEPAARTHWHRHEVTQVLHVTTGLGWIQNRDGDASPLRPGDVVHIPAGEEHWHGAQPDSCMSHLAVSIGVTEWLDPVTDEDYGRAFAGG